MRRVKVELIVDSDGAVRGIRDVRGEVHRLDDTVDRSRKRLIRWGDALRVGVTLAVAKAVQVTTRFGGALYDMGLAAEETQSKFETTFGEMAAGMDAFGRRFANVAGMTQNEFREMTATLATFAQGMQLSQEESAAFAADVVKLAADLASFNNIPIEDALQALRSGLAGEIEPLRRFGIELSADEVKMRALMNTAKRTEDQLTSQELTIARLQLAYEKAGKQVGDLNRTMDSTANTARRARAELREAIQQVAQDLLPVFSELTQEVAAFVRENRHEIAELIETFARGVTKMLIEAVRLVNWITSPDGIIRMNKMLVDSAEMIGTLLEAIGGVVNFGKSIGEYVGADASGLSTTAAAIDSAVESLDAFIEARETVISQQMAEKQRREAEAARAAAEAQKELAVGTLVATEATERERQALRAFAATLREVKTLAADTIKISAKIDFEERFREVRGERPDFKDILPDDIQSMLGTVDYTTVDDLDGYIAALQDGLSTLTTDSARAEVEALISKLKGLRDELALSEGKVLDIGTAIEAGLADSIAAAAAAVGSGENVAKAILGTLADLAQRVGKMLVGFGVAALGLQQLVTNPLAAIAAGAALIALGAAAKQAIGGAVSSATGGRAASGGGTRLVTGGEAGLEIRSPQVGAGSPMGPAPRQTVPGRASGGPVTAGQLYQVNERGQKEYFMPAMDGVVLTPGQMQAARTASAGSPAMARQERHRIEVENRTHVDITENTNMWDFVTRIEETQAIKKRLAG